MKGLKIIHKNHKPYGIRDEGGLLLLFPRITKWSGQEDRYVKEIKEQFDLADTILKALKNEPLDGLCLVCQEVTCECEYKTEEE